MGEKAQPQTRIVPLARGISSPAYVLTLRFVSGSIEIHGDVASAIALPGAARDDRSGCLRAPAVAYAAIVRALTRQKVPFVDEARHYETLALTVRASRDPRPYQTEALDAWRAAQGRGVVVLPTGAGKSHLAVMAISEKQRATLVVAPTLDLVRQWYDLLGSTFGQPVGLVGGGEHRVETLTVTTYDSAHLHMDHLGSRFGFVIFDECHHLPSGAYAHAALACLAPFRMGLSATLERTDGRDANLVGLIGPTVYRKEIGELAGEYLASYDTETIAISFSPEERAAYDEARGIYRGFIQKHHIRMGDPAGWGTFIRLSAGSAEGQEAMRAYRRQRELAFTAPAKMQYLSVLLKEHRHDQIIIFTQDNASAYRIASDFLLPVITHQTKVRERSHILKGFTARTYGAIVTSKVLNEGVDVPEASVAIIVSGSGSVREHVQRLGRILRQGEGKQALLYELVTEATAEGYVSERRRDHDAYR